MKATPAAAGLPVAALERVADANAFGSLGLPRREALWTIQGLANAVMPLFSGANEHDKLIQPEATEPAVARTPMTAGREVVEDDRSKGLTLRQHPLAFLRAELHQGRIRSCADLRHARDGQRMTVAGLVLVRHKPGSAKGVTFMMIEAETDVASITGGMDEPEIKIIDVFICKLRKKPAQASGGRSYIETVWGRGYMLREPPAMRMAS